MGSRRMENRLGNVETAGKIRSINGQGSDKTDLRSRIGVNDVRVSLQDRIGNQRDASANLSRSRDFQLETVSRRSQIPMDDARRMLEHASHIENSRQRGRENGPNMTVRSRGDIQVRVANDGIPDLMDVTIGNVPSYERKRKSDYYDEPVRKDMKVVIHQELDPNILARENPLRINLRQENERSRHLADLVVNEALDRGYDDYRREMETRDVLERDRFQEYDTRMFFDDLGPRYRSPSLERRPRYSGRHLSPEEYFRREDDYPDPGRRRPQKVPSYVRPYNDRFSPVRERYSPIRDPNSPNLRRARDREYVDRRPYNDPIIPRPISTSRTDFILDSSRMARQEEVFSRNLYRKDRRMEREIESARIPQREVPVASIARGKNNPGGRLVKRQPQQRAKTNNTLQEAESSGQSTSSRSNIRKTVTLSEKKQEEPKIELKPKKPQIPKFEQIIDASLRNQVAEMTPKKRADFKMQELDVVPMCTDRTLNERFSSILSVVS